MELALLLVFLVFVELAFTVWFLARQRDYIKRVKRVERNVSKLAEMVSEGSADALDAAPSLDDVDLTSLVDIINTATPDELAQAQALINAFVHGKED